MVLIAEIFKSNQRVQRLGDKDTHAYQRQPLGGEHLQGWLIGDRIVGLTRGHQLGRCIGIGRGDHLDVEAVFGEETALLGDHQRGMVGIDEPVEQEANLVLSGRGHRGADKGQCGNQLDQLFHRQSP